VFFFWKGPLSCWGFFRQTPWAALFLRSSPPPPAKRIGLSYQKTPPRAGASPALRRGQGSPSTSHFFFISCFFACLTQETLSLGTLARELIFSIGGDEPCPLVPDSSPFLCLSFFCDREHRGRQERFPDECPLGMVTCANDPSPVYRGILSFSSYPFS